MYRSSISHLSLPALAAVFAVLSASCTFAERVANDPVEYNKSAAQARDRILMLNVLRAADGYPMQFSALAQVRGSLVSEATTGGSSTLTEGGATTFTPTLGGTLRSNPSFDVSILDSAEFMKGILQPVDINTLQSYSDKGWRSRMLAYMLIEEIRVTIKTDDDNKSVIYAIPNEPRDSALFERYLSLLLDFDPEAASMTEPELLKALQLVHNIEELRPNRKKVVFENDDELVAEGKVEKDSAILGLAQRVLSSDGYTLKLDGDQLQVRRPKSRKLRTVSRRPTIGADNNRIDSGSVTTSPWSCARPRVRSTTLENSSS